MPAGHKKEIMAVHDAMDVLSGKWKISSSRLFAITTKEDFLISLNDVNGISNKMLSKELKELEMNKLV
jgi:DNA-binding HxlR family transcriptional regulator